MLYSIQSKHIKSNDIVNTEQIYLNQAEQIILYWIQSKHTYSRKGKEGYCKNRANILTAGRAKNVKPSKCTNVGQSKELNS